MTDTQPTFDALRLRPGIPLHLEIDEQSGTPAIVTLVGYQPGRSILVTTPIERGHPMHIRPETGIGVRLYAGRDWGACTFRTYVLYATAHPFEHLHLAMPERLFLGEARQAERAPVHLHATMVFFGERSSTEIVELSALGGRVRTRENRFQVGQEITMVTKLTLGSIERVMRLHGIVRYFEPNDHSGIGTIGLQWHRLDENDTIALQAYVLERLRATDDRTRET